MIFRTLSMAGFKSFAEKTEIDIENGLTGIVGPNGCGKSNVVEAIRWVMGESNARQMRGGEMDDVIFAGTDKRPARSIAEISLALDNQARKAPAEFNHQDELVITRKIERGKGSNYQVNGRPARAKDVQLLFADTATGARSAGIVSQGRIGAIVGAKPEDRRSLIEEAANIKGLHQRKHEAELRLKNTENNLERVQDLITQLEEQRGQLAKQARQAARYASVADRIRKAEAQLFFAKYHQAQTEEQTADEALKQQKTQVDEATRHAAQTAAKQAETAATLPELRQREAEAAAEMQRLKLAIAEYDREAERVTLSLNQIQNQLQQIEDDATREAGLHDDATTAIAQLDEEKRQLHSERASTQPAYEAAKSQLEQVQQASQQADMLAAEAQSLKNNAQTAKSQLEAQITQLTARIHKADTDLQQIDLPGLQKQAQDAQNTLSAAMDASTQAEQALIQAEALLHTKNEASESLREEVNAAESQAMRLTAEIDALAYLLAENQPDEGTPAADSISVTQGYEAALSACLGSDILLPFSGGTQGYWRDDYTPASAVPPPQTGTALSHFIHGSHGLEHAISGVGVVETDDIAAAAQDKLSAGQMLVTPQGHVYRWDGLVRLQPSSAEAERIKQKQRLSALNTENEAAQQHFNALKTQADEKTAERDDAKMRFDTAKQQHRNAETALREAERASEKAIMSAEAAANRAEDIENLRHTAQQDLQQSRAQFEASADIQSLTAEAEARAEAARTAKAALNDANAEIAQRAQQLQTASRRIEEIDRQQADWQKRLTQTDSRQEQLEQRRKTTLAEQAQLNIRPAEIERDKQQALVLSEQSEERHSAENDALRMAENLLLEQDRESKEAERQLGSYREQLIRCEARSERAQSQSDNLRSQIAEKLQTTADKLHELAQLPPEEILATPVDRLESTLHRLLREREQIGPVNLRAEVEMQELDHRMTEMKRESDDLTEAIAKLRSAISSLNREGRMRLLDSFSEVNRHFTTLFTQLFGGGHAELQLTDSEDPLEAGLEILASPPGKKLQSLSLLSGGEQALTALAIIFAVFLTNPAPICILDEVDAPLDDGNVERFCDLLRQIAQQTQTRFLVVTHHRMTMARMDRLFGVTMEHQGISRLVSVDLQTAETMRERMFA